MPLLDTWTRRRAQERPYRWLSIVPGELLTEERARGLADVFPADSLERHNASGRIAGKRYRNSSRTIVARDVLLDDSLPPPWRELVADLMSLDYREGVGAVLEQDVADCLELRLVLHGPGDWLGPHTDREDKLFSHILYFNAGWREEWGGCLEVLDSDDPGAVAGKVVPRLGASALLAQAPNSWHQVTEVRGAPARSRRSLLVHGMRGN